MSKAKQETRESERVAREKRRDARDAERRDQRRAAKTVDRYVIGGVRWEGVSHQKMHEMLHRQASPDRVEDIANRWRARGASIEELTGQFGRLLATLESSWQSRVAMDAVAVLKSNAEWMAELARTTSEMSRPLEEAAAQLRLARQAMPEPPAPRIDAGEVVLSAASGGAAGAVAGPTGMLVGTFVGGSAAVVTGLASRAELKQRAVEVMRQHEFGAQLVDSGTPRFSDERPAGPWAPPAEAGTGGTGGGGGTGPVPPPHVGGQAAGSPSSQNGTTVPSWVDAGPEARWQAMTSAPAATPPGGGQPLAGPGVGGPGVVGVGGRPGMPGTPFGAVPGGPGVGAGRSTGVLGGEATRAGDTARAGTRAAAGSPGGHFGAFAPPATQREEDQERRRRYPYDLDLFGEEGPAMPPVIGE